ncbi:MAG: hypothetical protein KY475_21450 [Planctomycetes bacterium]|nr:hypothetical protein [Planctomycetota bacterium]
MNSYWPSKNAILVAVLTLSGAALVYRAALVQGASVHLIWGGAAIGAFLAIAIAAGRVSLDTVGAVGGSLVALQFGRLFLCDGSIFVVPVVGATLGAVGGFFVQELCSVSSPSRTLKLTRPNKDG